jgi:predicted dehydrogenase
MQTQLKVGVVGVGALGQWHARVYSELPNAELVGVYDQNRARAADIARQYRTRAFDSLDDLAAVATAASIAVPTDRHHDVALALIAKGRHLLVEKPIAATTAEAEAMVTAARNQGTILQVGHVERFNPVMKYLESVLTRPRFIEALRLAPYPPPRDGLPPRGTEVSVVLDLMIHDLEIILHLVQAPLREFHAIGVPVLSSSEDIANVRLAFANGCVANINASRISRERTRKIRVFQPDAYLSLDYQNQSGVIHRKTLQGIVPEEVPIEKSEPLVRELASFVACVQHRGEPVVGAEHASEALRLAASICQHIRAGGS